MNCCEAHKKLTRDIKGFLDNVGGVKEESITDFLVWQLGLIDNQFQYNQFKSIKTGSLRVVSRQEESETGADFEMEVWLVGRTLSYPLVFQAKKLIEQYDSYRSKLNYPQTKPNRQIDKLLEHAKTEGKIPFYAFYNGRDKHGNDTQVMCGKDDVSDCGVFIAHAEEVKKFADSPPRSKISKNDLLAESNPFYCIFCCWVGFREYLEKYFSGIDIDKKFGRSELPGYVSYLLDIHNNEINVQESKERIKQLIEDYKLEKFRHIVVYDMRRNETTHEKEIDTDTFRRNVDRINWGPDGIFSRLINNCKGKACSHYTLSPYIPTSYLLRPLINHPVRLRLPPLR